MREKEKKETKEKNKKVEERRTVWRKERKPDKMDERVK